MEHNGYLDCPEHAKKYTLEVMLETVKRVDAVKDWETFNQYLESCPAFFARLLFYLLKKESKK